MHNISLLPKSTLPIIIVIASASLFSACNHDDDEENGTTRSKASNPYELVLTALGGKQAINNASQISFHVEGKAYEFQEQPEPASELVSNFSYDISATLDASKLRQQWQINTDYAFDIAMVFTEVIDNSVGVVIDGPNSFGAYAFGAFGVPPEPMNSAKLATRQKTWFMSSPLAIVASIIEENPDESTTFNNDNELTTQFQGNEVTLRLDDQNHLPISAETLEFDPLLGDVVYKVEYADWQAVGDTYYPQQVIHKLDGHVIRDEALSNLQIGEVDQTNFDFAGIEPNTHNADKAASGYLSSQFYVRGLMMGFPFDAIDETAIVSEFIDNEDKVLRILGTDHYSYAFLIDEHIYIYDAPVNNARQQAVLAEVQQKFPGNEIGGVILSHNHFDHAGGFRGALAEGGDLYVGSSSADFYQALLTRPHSLQPNPLQLRDSVSVNAIDPPMSTYLSPQN